MRVVLKENEQGFSSLTRIGSGDVLKKRNNEKEIKDDLELDQKKSLVTNNNIFNIKHTIDSMIDIEALI